MSSAVETATEIRPFDVDVPDEALEDLRRRIAATRWPERETVADQSQGVPLAIRRVGAAAAVLTGDPSGFPVTALTRRSS
jgi:hypothetical protein